MTMIYLDHNATTPMDPRVLDVMLPMFGEQFANPASKHAAGQAASGLVERARTQVAGLLGTIRRSVVFTSGATEAIHLGVRGAFGASGRTRLLVGATEHPAVFAAARATRAQVETVRVHRNGTLDLEHLEELLDRDVSLVAVTAANNETGVLNDISAIAEVTHLAGALLACDVTQAVGRVPVRLTAWGVDLAFCSAHKLHGPKGVGALVVSRPVQARLRPLVEGGGQERGMRAGTLNTPAIVGFGAACAIAEAELAEASRRQRELTGLLHDLLAARVEVQVNGEGAERLPNTINLRFVGATADAVQTCAPEVLISAGSACSSGKDEPSHVLLAMGLNETEAEQSLRFSLGTATTEQEVRRAAELIGSAVERVRQLNQTSGAAMASGGTPQ